ncbi:MAG: hypothetical protein ACFFDH_20275 [Promethearchaeota archaeon]
MTQLNQNEKFLSKKLVERLNLAVSPLLKNKLEKCYEYLKEINENNVDYKTFSRFLRKIMSFFVEIFESGKSFNDIKKALKRDVSKFVEKNSHMQVTLIQEDNVKLNKYYHFEKSLYSIFMGYMDAILKDGHLNDKEVLELLKSFRAFALGNKLTKKFDVEIMGNYYIVTYVGTYENIHFEQSKVLLAIAGFLGVELVSYTYTPRYLKMTLRKTDKVNKLNVSMDDRIIILKKNLNKFLNYKAIINDKKVHSWIRFSSIKDSIISFNDYERGKEIIEEVIKDLITTSKEKKKDRLKLFLKDNILKLFEKFNWIVPFNKNEDKFTYLISDNRIEYKLSQYFLDEENLEKTLKKIKS